MALGPMGPVSREFLWNCAKMAKDTGVDKWVPKFWEAANAGKGEIAANFYRTIVTVIKNNAGKAFAADMEAMLPEMGAALANLGIDISAEALSAAVGETAMAAAGLNPVGIAIAALLIIAFFAAGKAFSEELPPRKLPRQVPPPLRGNPHIDPVANLKMQLDGERILHTYRFIGNVH